MSLQSYNLLSLKKLVKLVTQNAPDLQMIVLDDIVNEAYMQIVTHRKWAWRRATASLDVVLDQSWVALPADLASLDILHVRGTTTGLGIPVTLDQLSYLRVNSQSAVVQESFAYYYALSWAPQASAIALPQPRLEIFPTPTIDAAGVFQIVYSRVPAKLVADTDVLDIPPQFQQAVRHAVRTNALRESGKEGWEDDQAVLDKLLASLATEDGLLQPSLGRMHGVATAGQSTIIRADPVVNWPA